ncbi:putative pectate lyase D [Aspergillus pseudodeflectus]|uniref:Pectate lyase n=1 Tax=Aspergillus pseudodeflectus TaxID=176178 RepID=A0ABR4KJW2_9EURO
MFFQNTLILSLATSVLATQSHGIRSHPRYNQPRFNRLDRRFTFPLPESQGSETFSEPYVVSGNETFDGGMKTFGRGVSCSEGEGGDSDAVFMVENGGTLKNLIIGADQIEGVHCEGSCTIENVWWEAVCEDALSLKTGSGPFTVIGGGAQGAQDKVIQHNGGGTVSISGFTVYNFGKLYRSCGNCDEMYERHVTIEGVTAVEGSSTLVGINSNYGDTATIKSDTCVEGVETVCAEYEGNDTGDEPEKISEGPSSACQYSDPLPAC